MYSSWGNKSFFSVYDVSGAASDRNVVVLNDIHIDIMDYIVPATCTDTEFRQMWAEFEWENKVCFYYNFICFFVCIWYVFQWDLQYFDMFYPGMLCSVFHGTSDVHILILILNSNAFHINSYACSLVWVSEKDERVLYWLSWHNFVWFMIRRLLRDLFVVHYL